MRKFTRWRFIWKDFDLFRKDLIYFDLSVRDGPFSCARSTFAR
jgi:hypothetical protein